MKIKKANLIILLLEVFMVVLLVTLFYKLMSLQNEQNEQNLTFKKMEDLSDVLKQSSDDLTRFARSYVVTKDEKYKTNYYVVLDIRNGSFPRPLEYDKTYWSLSKEYREQEHSVYGDPISFKMLVSRLPFTNYEKELLAISEKNSNRLAEIEIKAFDTLEGNFIEPNQQKAINLLYSMDYHDAKQEIMKPIDIFLHQLDRRIEKSQKEIAHKIKNQTYILIAVIILFIVLNLFLYTYLKRIDLNLLKEKQKYKSLVEDIGEKFVFYSHKLNGEMVYANGSAKKVFGLSNEEIIGYDFKKLVNWTKDSLLKIEEVKRKLIYKETQSIQYEISFLDKKSEERFLQVTSHAIFGEDYNTIDGIIEDITDQKLLLEELKKRERNTEII